MFSYIVTRLLTIIPELHARGGRKPHIFSTPPLAPPGPRGPFLLRLVDQLPAEKIGGWAYLIFSVTECLPCEAQTYFRSSLLSDTSALLRLQGAIYWLTFQLTGKWHRSIFHKEPERKVEKLKYLIGT